MPDITLTAAVAVTTSVQAPSIAGSGSAPITISPVAVTATVQAPSISGSGSVPITIAPVAVVASVGYVYLDRGIIINAWIDSLLVTELINWAGFEITDSLGNIKGLYITVKEGTNAAQDDEIIILDKRTSKRVFGGLVKEVTRRYLRKDYYLADLLCQDYTRIIDLVTEGVSLVEGTYTEREVLETLFSAHAPDITVGTHVINPGASVDIGWGNVGLRQAITDLAALNNRVWYVDYYKELHYFALGGEAAPFGLSDNPNGTTTFKYGELVFTEDTVNNEQRGSLLCWEEGLYSGQTLQITNAKQGWAAQEFLIYEISASLIGGDMYNDPEVVYAVSFGSRPKRVTDRIPVTPEEEEPPTVATAAGALEFVIDQGAQAIVTGEKGHLQVPLDFTGEIIGVTVLANTTGSIKIDIWKDTPANYPPTDADSICGGNEPEITSGDYYHDQTLTSWTKTLNPGDILAYNVDSCTTINRVTIVLHVKEVLD